MTHKVIWAIGISLSLQISVAQPVVFTYQGDRLNSVFDLTAYADCVVDMNNDHLDDVVRIGNKGIFIDYQQLNGLFSQEFFSMPIESPPDWSICAGDLDNNGYNDLLLASGGKVSFVKANENGTEYQEIVMPVFILSQRSTLADINNDGWLDGFVCNEAVLSVPFRNDGEGHMAPDPDLIPTAALPGNYAAIWTDYDNDRDIDLYISKCLAGIPPGNIIRTNLLYQNNGDGTFSEVGAQAGLDDNAQSWSTVFEDFDNDGDFDCFIVNHDFNNRLFRNNGDGTFTDVIIDSGINPDDLGAWENSSGDFNNDGFMDIFSELRRELYLGNGDMTFTEQDGPVLPGAIGDLNNDGFLDVYRANHLWINEGNGNHWLKVSLLGISSNRNGIGARVEIYGAWGAQVREVRSGQSYSPMSSLNVHFGLGQNDQVDSLRIHWPSGILTTLKNLKADSAYIVPEVECLLPPTLLTINGSLSICPGDTTQLLAPTGFSNYLWSTGQSGQKIEVNNEGLFFAILTDSNGCVSLTHSVEIRFIKDSVPLIFSPEGSVICQGDTLILKASPGNNYSWSNGLSGIQSIAVTEGGSYTVATDALCSMEQLISTPFEVMVLHPPLPIVVEDHIIQLGDSILLTVTGDNCEWYDQPSGGNLLATGSTFQTMPLLNTSSYFVECHHLYPTEFQQGGKPDTSGINGPPLQGGYLLFEIWQPCILLSVTVYVPSGLPLENRFVQLWAADTLMVAKAFAVQSGINVLDLNFELPVGRFSLRCPQGNLLRNEAPLDFPYPIGDMGEITGSSIGTDYYYYFYDWKILTPEVECTSERIPVNIIVTGNENIDNDIHVSIYPNPTSGILFFEFNDNVSIGAFKVIDVFGRVVPHQMISVSNGITLHLETHLPGIYFLQFMEDNKLSVKRIILE